MAKKKMDSISKAGAPAEQPVVETVAPHQAPAPNGALAETPIPMSQPSATTGPEVTPQKPGDDFDVMFPEPGVAITPPPGWIWWLVLLILSLVLAGVGYAILRHRINNWISVATPTPIASTVTATATPSPTSIATATPSPTTTPSATPSPSANSISSITMRVLNGTTTAGAANTAKNILTKAGFTVRTIGNASTQNYASTVIYYQAGHQADAKLVQNALTGYSVTLQESSLANPDMILVVIGKK